MIIDIEEKTARRFLALGLKLRANVTWGKSRSAVFSSHGTRRRAEQELGEPHE